MPDPKSALRAAVLTGAMTFEPAPLDPFALRVTPVRRIVDRIAPPLDLQVIPFRYRVGDNGTIRAVKPACAHQRRR